MVSFTTSVEPSSYQVATTSPLSILPTFTTTSFARSQVDIYIYSSYSVKLVDDELELELELDDIELELDELLELELELLELDAKNPNSKYGLRVLLLFSLLANPTVPRDGDIGSISIINP